MNTTPDGELFGSGDPEQNQDITMYIESAELSERHADIKYEDADGQLFDEGADCEDNDKEGNYILRDCDSETGTWVRVKCAFDEHHYPLLVNLNEQDKREFKVD